MATWKDCNGKEWTCQITIKTLKKIKARLDIDFLELEKSIKIIMSDVFKLCDVLYLIHEEECQKLGITDEDFGGLLVGDSIEGATQALIDGMTSFFPKQQREMLEKITNKREQVTAEIYKRIGTEIDNLPMDKVIELIQDKFGVQFSKPQAQSV